MPQQIGLGGFGGTAVNDLGLGSMLQDQVAGETSEERKKRMQQQQQQATGLGQSPATLALFGGMGGLR